MWQENVIRDGKEQTQQGPVRAAVAAVREAIGLGSTGDQLVLA